MSNLLGKQDYTNYRFSYKYGVSFLAHLKNRKNNSNEPKIWE